jgi:Protein of unknown function (DUF3995)
VRTWPAYAAAAWAFLFAAVSFYWAAGGRLGVGTIGRSITEPIEQGDPVAVAALWLTAVLKVVGGLVALALVRRWGRRLRRLALGLVWTAGVLLTIYGAALLVQHGLMAADVVGKGTLDDTAIRGHLLLWDPYWLLGGLLYLAAARSVSRRRPRPAPVGQAPA